MSKKWIVLVLLLLAAFTLTACGNNNKEVENTISGETPITETKGDPSKNYTIDYTNGGLVVLKDYKGEEKNITIPAEYDGVAVVRISDRTFSA